MSAWYLNSNGSLQIVHRLLPSLTYQTVESIAWRKNQLTFGFKVNKYLIVYTLAFKPAAMICIP